MINKRFDAYNNLSVPEKQNKDIILKFVSQNGLNLEYVLKQFKDDIDVVMESVKNKPVAIQYASKRLKAEYKVAIEAVKKDSMAFMHIHKYLRYNKDIVFEAMKTFYELYRKNMKRVYNKTTFVGNFNKIHNTKYIPHIIPVDFLSDKDFMMKFVDIDVNSVYDASNKLHMNADYMYEYIKRTKQLGCIHSSLLRNKEFILRILKINGSLIEKIESYLRVDRDVILIALHDYDNAMYITSYSIPVYIFKDFMSDVITDREYVKKAVKINGMAIRDCDKKFKSDKEIVMYAVKSNKKCLIYVDDELKKDNEILFCVGKKMSTPIRAIELFNITFLF